VDHREKRLGGGGMHTELINSSVGPSEKGNEHSLSIRSGEIWSSRATTIFSRVLLHGVK
jgi:hypothetical protein